MEALLADGVGVEGVGVGRFLTRCFPRIGMLSL